MAGWTVALGPTAPVLAAKLDAGEKVGGLPAFTAGQAGWWRDFSWKVRALFAQQCQLNGPVPTSITFSANNGAAGDSAGLGTLTITITTA